MKTVKELEAELAKAKEEMGLEVIASAMRKISDAGIVVTDYEADEYTHFVARTIKFRIQGDEDNNICHLYVQEAKKAN